jgi:hypothetical protein
LSDPSEKASNRWLDPLALPSSAFSEVPKCVEAAAHGAKDCGYDTFEVRPPYDRMASKISLRMHGITEEVNLIATNEAIVKHVLAFANRHTKNAPRREGTPRDHTSDALADLR